MRPSLAYFSCGKIAVTFRSNKALGIRDEYSFRGRIPTAHTLACLHIAGHVTTTVARLTTGWGGYPLCDNLIQQPIRYPIYLTHPTTPNEAENLVSAVEHGTIWKGPSIDLDGRCAIRVLILGSCGAHGHRAAASLADVKVNVGSADQICVSSSIKEHQ
jgi:hypothetical protein